MRRIITAGVRSIFSPASMRCSSRARNRRNGTLGHSSAPAKKLHSKSRQACSTSCWLRPAFGPCGTQVDLEQTIGNAFKTYAGPAEAEAAEQLAIYQPGYLPEGFVLRQVQVLRVCGVPIQILNYSDGLNLLSVASQPEIDPLKILFSGLVNLNYYAITRRMIILESYAPYDFYGRFTPRTQSIVFGDLPSQELRRISDSLPVP